MAKNQWDTVDDLAAEDIIDSRDMEKAIDELEGLVQETEDAEENGDNPNPMDEEQMALLKALKEARDCCGREWIHGVAFIRESYFKEYAEQLADDIGAIDKDAKWPANHIDWDAAADALKQDYSSCKINGVDYWFRD